MVKKTKRYRLDPQGSDVDFAIHKGPMWTSYVDFLEHTGYGGIRVDHPTAQGVVIRNNIAWGNNGFDIRGDNETAIDHNLCREALCEVQTDPQFVDASADDFQLLGSSSAIDSGSALLAPSDDIDGVNRPQGAGFDLGAYETL